LRRLIDDKLSHKYGANYLEAKDELGKNVINARLRRDLAERKSKEPKRYPRHIDAAMLDSEIDILCNPVLYKAHFKEALHDAFPDGCDEARTFLRRLLPPRNALSHANPISVRQAERVLCYAHDVIDCLKEFYKKQNVETEYNVPTILLLRDSFGHLVHRSEMIETGVGCLYTTPSGDPARYLRPGDTLSLEVEVDPTFPSADYDLHWKVAGRRAVVLKNRPTQLVLRVQLEHVGEVLYIESELVTKRGWHRCGDYDDSIEIHYKVLPPVS
jgi:hypothetical protein